MPLFPIYFSLDFPKFVVNTHRLTHTYTHRLWIFTAENVSKSTHIKYQSFRTHNTPKARNFSAESSFRNRQTSLLSFSKVNAPPHYFFIHSMHTHKNMYVPLEFPSVCCNGVSSGLYKDTWSIYKSAPIQRERKGYTHRVVLGKQRAAIPAIVWLFD